MLQKLDVRSLTEQLTPENRKYVIAVANALIFSQGKKTNQNKPHRKTLQVYCETQYTSPTE